ncbi:MAG: 3-oxoacyl-ACP synthase [Pseudonocardiaceae bacterium]
MGPVATWFPDRACPIPELPELGEWGAAQRAQLLALGVDEVRDAGPSTEVELATRAARDAMDAVDLVASDVDGLLLVEGRVREYLLASEATRLQAAIGAHRALTMGIGELGCVSVSAALLVAASLLHSQPSWRTVLLAMGARTPTARRFRPPMTVLGDGAAAVVISRDPIGPYRILDHRLTSDGRYSDLFHIRYRDVPTSQWWEECTDVNTYSFQLAVESRNRFRTMADELLKTADVPWSDLSSVIMQNLSVGAFAFWRDALDVDIDEVCRRNLAAFGHLGSIDVLLNLQHAASRLRRGDMVLMLNSSPVAAWSTALLEYVDGGE